MQKLKNCNTLTKCTYVLYISFLNCILAMHMFWIYNLGFFPFLIVYYIFGLIMHNCNKPTVYLLYFQVIISSSKVIYVMNAKGAFNNYVDKMRGGGVKKCPRLGYKNCPRKGGGQKMAKFCPRSCWMPPNETRNGKKYRPHLRLCISIKSPFISFFCRKITCFEQ